MSRYYEMQIHVNDNNSERDAEICAAVEDEWNVSDSWEQDGGTVFCGQGNLCGGESPSEFTKRVAQAVWKANGGYCEVSVTAIDLDDPPTDVHTASEEEYQRYVQSLEKKET